MHVLLFVCLLCHVVDSFVLVHNVERNVTSVLTVDNGDRWGDWGPAHFCAAGTFAVGYSMKVFQIGEDKQGILMCILHAWASIQLNFPTLQQGWLLHSWNSSLVAHSEFT